MHGPYCHEHFHRLWWAANQARIANVLTRFCVCDIQYFIYTYVDETNLDFSYINTDNLALIFTCSNFHHFLILDEMLCYMYGRIQDSQTEHNTW